MAVATSTIAELNGLTSPFLPATSFAISSSILSEIDATSTDRCMSASTPNPKLKRIRRFIDSVHNLNWEKLLEAFQAEESKEIKMAERTLKKMAAPKTG
uniref:Uncharacterized protein n=1 Tax=Chenopodium quinoa TaxID=63459 RepID=A0A803LJW9_CHEQI